MESACRYLVFADMHNARELKSDAIKFIAQNSSSIIIVCFCLSLGFQIFLLLIMDLYFPIIYILGAFFSFSYKNFCVGIVNLVKERKINVTFNKRGLNVILIFPMNFCYIPYFFSASIYFDI